MSESYGDHPIRPLEPGWIAVAIGRDLPAGGALPVVLGGREIVLWRGDSGAVRAWDDRCPHRGMRLSFGFVRGETLACLYHGWRYGADGRCEHIPAHPDLVPPATIAASARPVAEAAGLVWLRAGGEAPGPAVPPGAWTGALSVTVDVPAADLAAAVAAEAGEGRLAAVQPVLDRRARLHVAVRSGAAVPAAMLWAEGLQRRLEAAALGSEAAA